MKPFQTVHSKTIPLPFNDLDTDQIIPAQYLTSISSEGYGENLFRRLRDESPEFPLNLERYRGAEVLVVGENFGCGSSREHAVWALIGAGIKVVIGKSFADIFTSNSAKNGLLLVALPPEVVDELGDRTVTVDLERQSVTVESGASYTFDYDPFRKHCLLKGLDDIDYILSHRNEIAAFRMQQVNLT
jgi:3-isopropylmalate/(R)-2-methylmalate dehydratase small subunit